AAPHRTARRGPPQPDRHRTSQRDARRTGPRRHRRSLLPPPGLRPGPQPPPFPRRPGDHRRHTRHHRPHDSRFPTRPGRVAAPTPHRFALPVSHFPTPFRPCGTDARSTGVTTMGPEDTDHSGMRGGSGRSGRMGGPRRPRRRYGMGDTNAPDAPMIDVCGLRKTYPGGVEAVKAIDFQVAPGEVFGLLGPNGAGKSTTIGMLTTTIIPSGGWARVSGFDVVTDPIGARQASAVVFQDAAVDRSLTGWRNLEIHARLWGVPRSELQARIGATVELFGLSDII